MEAKLIHETNVPLLSRKRMTFMVEHKGTATPKMDDIQKKIATVTKHAEESIKIQHVYPQFGREEAKVIVHAYDSPEALQRIETINKKPKQQKKE